MTETDRGTEQMTRHITGWIVKRGVREVCVCMHEGNLTAVRFRAGAQKNFFDCWTRKVTWVPAASVFATYDAAAAIAIRDGHEIGESG